MLIPILLGALTVEAIPAAPNTGASLALQEPVSKTAPSASEQPWPPAGVFRRGADVISPKPTKQVLVSYTPDAMRAKVQGSVVLQAVVRADGTVGEVRVMRSLDTRYGLDDEAVKALKQWQFTPGQKDGEPVPVIVEVEMTFTIGKRRR
jgi:protein TonB